MNPNVPPDRLLPRLLHDRPAEDEARIALLGSLAPPAPVQAAQRGVTLSANWFGWQGMTKRLLDIVVAALLLLALAPVLALIAIAIRLESAGPVIFRQPRCGRGGAYFAYYKFRSMVVDAEARRIELEEINEADGPIFKIRRDPRISRVGRVLRRTSLDELPQLWNVLRGEMSLVGPRPPLPSEVAKYGAWEHNRLLVRGGMTGLWQVSGRSDLSFQQMVILDATYIERWSLWLDLRILARTVLAVASTRGAY